MRRNSFYLIFSLTFLFGSCFFNTTFCNPLPVYTITNYQDTLSGTQALYNGRVWRDIYSHKVSGDQFLFSKEFFPGNVQVNGKSYYNINIRYDIYSDEIMIVTDQNVVLQLNKEMVDMFKIKYANVDHLFIRLEPDSINSLSGYVDVLYKGKMELYVKYIKEIIRTTEGRISDVFVQTEKVYVLKDGKAYEINNKKDFFRLLYDKKVQVRNYMKTNKYRVSVKIPLSFVPVMKFYDSIIP